MKHVTIVSAVFLMAATAVNALSCLPSDIRQSYQDAAKAKDGYVIATGRIIFDEKKLPKQDFAHQERAKPNNFLPAKFRGMAMGKNGFTIPYNPEITINAQCYGPWCAGMNSGMEYLVFLRRTASGDVLEINPCGGFAYGNPTPEMRDAMLACYRGKSCKPTRP